MGIEIKDFFFSLFILLVAIMGILPSTAVAGSDRYETAGNLLTVVLPAAAYSATYYLDDDTGRTQFYQSFLTTLGATYALKYSVDAKRPDGDKQSFPSGHATLATSGAAFIQMRYGWTYGLPAYMGAAYVGWSRVHADRHYPRDVYAGAALSIAVSSYFVDRKEPDAPQVSLWSDGNIFGLAMTGRW